MANLSDAQMETYLRIFHEEYLKSVEQFVPAELRDGLLRYTLLPAAVTGYVSTQFGAGYEYRAGEGSISIVRGSSRVEELFVDGPAWLPRLPAMLGVGGPNIGVVGLTLDGGFPFRFTDESADIYFHNVRFKAREWSRTVLYAQLFGNRSEAFWAETEAVRRAKDEVLAIMFDLQQSAARHVDLGTYLRTFKQRTVLLLGDFKEGRARLQAIRESLAKVGYHAVLLDEIPEEPNYDLQQKFQAVASVCRFLVFEDSTPAGQIAELILAEGLRSVRIILREEEQQSTFMTRAMGLTSTVVKEWSYQQRTLDDVVEEAVRWAESVLSQLAESREITYPWRADAFQADAFQTGAAQTGSAAGSPEK